MRIAIITARGGSKRIPRKNIKLFCGKPVIQYSIEAAIESEVFDKVMVSTDDFEIAEISKKYGAEVPFMRSNKTADDYATTADVLFEVLSEYEKRGYTVEQFCCIYPTAPFITAEKLRKGMDLLRQNQVDSVVPVVKYSFPPQRSFVVKEGILRMTSPEFVNTRSQDLEAVYHDCGQFYCVNTESFKKQKKVYMEKSLPFIFPETEVQDIDDETDWKIAEMKYELMISRG